MYKSFYINVLYFTFIRVKCTKFLIFIIYYLLYFYYYSYCLKNIDYKYTDKPKILNKNSYRTI